MKLSDILKNMKYQEFTGYVLPSSIAASIIFLVIILDVIFGNYPEQKKEFVMISTGIGGSIYILLQTLLIAPRIKKYRTLYIWANAIISGLGLSLVAIALDETRLIFFDIATYFRQFCLQPRGPLPNFEQTVNLLDDRLAFLGGRQAFS